MQSLIELKTPDAALARLLPKQEPRFGVRYRPSQYAVCFSHRGKRYAYHTLTTQLVEAGLPEAAVWNDETDALIRDLFLVPEDKDECAYYNSVSSLMRTLKQKPGSHGFVILPTLRCNARCVYCYEAGRAQTTMTPETVEQTLRFILETHSEETVWISWFGGEPLLCPDIIERICAGLREANLAYQCDMISNGSLVTPAVIGKMTGPWHVKHIQISMDGAEADYIARKNYRVYRDDYHGVMEAVSRLSEAGIQVDIRCNVDEDNWERIPQFTQELGKGIAHKENVRLYFAPLNDVRGSDRALAMWQKVAAARPLIEAAGLKPSGSYNTGLRFRTHLCMVGGGTVVITPDGRLNPCEHCPEEGFYGNVFDGTTDEARRAEFCREDLPREKCRACPFLPCCTSFANCPTPQRNCREMRELFLLDELRRFIDRKAEENGAETESDVPTSDRDC